MKKTDLDVDFGKGNSDQLFYKLISGADFWNISCQKQFKDFDGK